MKKVKILIITLCFSGILTFTVAPLSAEVINVVSYWYDTGGTRVASGGEAEYAIGNTEGTVVAEIQVRYNRNLQDFQYAVSNQLADSDSYRIMYFAIDNPYSVSATDWTDGPNWSSWDPTHTNASPLEWVWQTTNFASGSDGGSKAYMRIYTTAPRGLVNGTIKFYASDGTLKYVYTGKVCGPVPEPSALERTVEKLPAEGYTYTDTGPSHIIPELTSLFLLGFSLLSLSAFRRARRKKN